jgi:hypothetical protein
MSMVGTIRLGTVVAAVAILVPQLAAADCTCRALGRDFELGRSACLATPNGPRYATCGMVLNNTSWRISDTPCILVQGEPEQVSVLAPPKPAPAGD